MVHERFHGEPPNTYHAKGIYDGMTGTGTSRIDAILVNRTAAHSSTHCKLAFAEAAGFDHVLIELEIDAEEFQQVLDVSVAPCQIVLPDTAALKGCEWTTRGKKWPGLMTS